MQRTRSDFHFVEREDPEKIAAVLIKACAGEDPAAIRPQSYSRRASPMSYEQGIARRAELNTALQQILTQPDPGSPLWRGTDGDSARRQSHPDRERLTTRRYSTAT